MTRPRRATRRNSQDRPVPVRRRGRPSKTQIELRDNELLDRALDLFLEQGFERTTIESISESISMSPRTIYARYRDKDALFKAALERAADEWTIPVKRLLDIPSEDFEECLLSIAKLLVANQISASGLRLTRIANVEVFRMPDIGSYLWERTAHPILAFLTELFHTRLVPGELDKTEAHEAALSFMILVVGGAFQSIAWSRVPEEELDRLTENRTRLFIAGVRAIHNPRPVPDWNSSIQSG